MRTFKGYTIRITVNPHIESQDKLYDYLNYAMIEGEIKDEILANDAIVFVTASKNDFRREVVHYDLDLAIKELLDKLEE